MSLRQLDSGLLQARSEHPAVLQGARLCQASNLQLLHTAQSQDTIALPSQAFNVETHC